MKIYFDRYTRKKPKLKPIKANKYPSTKIYIRRY